MNIEQMKTVLAEILTKTDLTPCVVGHRGVGKTAGIVQVCREMDLNYTSLRLGQMEVGDLVGIPYRDGETMHWSRPSWWPLADDAPTVVHCDELNRAQQEDTLQAIFQFVEPPVEGQSRALHTHQMDRRHKVVVTINPPDGTYQVATLDRALLDRMVLLYVESDYACWARYARERGLDDEVRQFLGANQQLLAAPGGAMDLNVEPSERAWEMVSLLRQHCRFPADLEMEVYAGIVGEAAAVTFLRWCAEQKGRPLSAEQVLDAWPEVSGQAAAQRDDAQAVTLHEVIALLQAEPELGETRETHLVAYLGVLPRDMRFALVKALLRIPKVANRLCDDRHDGAVMDVISEISRAAS